MSGTLDCSSVQVWKSSDLKKAGLRYFKEDIRNEAVLIC